MHHSAFPPVGFCPLARLFALATLLTMSSLTSDALPLPSKAAQAAGYDRPSGDPKQSRSVVLARHGMVATSHPEASEAGLRILQNGGNAADAAIAANAMLGVVEPMSCGIGGDLFVIYWDHKSQRLYGLNASGRSPRAASRPKMTELGVTSIPTSGPLSWSVPGCVNGWEALRSRFGTKPLAELLADSITTSNDGFPVTEIIAASWQGSAASLARTPDAAATYLIDNDRAPRFGEVFKNPRLAATYRKIAAGGAAAFYRGDIADRIVAYSQRQGGLFSQEDFADDKPDWIDPVSTNYRGYDAWELPPNGQGIAALQILNLLEPHDLKAWGPSHPEYLHRLIEAKKLAFADRARFYADPQMADVPVQQLISKEYALRQGSRIQANRAADDVPPGDPRLQHGDTIYLTVVDKDRNCCSLIQSLYFGFGSQLVPGDVGFALQNRGTLFAMDEHHPNRLEPGKRPFHTIIPAFVTRQGKPWFSFGVMGGDMQPQGHVQILVNLIDFGMNVQAAGDAARIQHIGSATPTGEAAKGSGTVLVESGISDGTIAALRAKGHEVLRAKGSFGGYQGILLDLDQGVLQGASESRKDGQAVGY